MINHDSQAPDTPLALAGHRTLATGGEYHLYVQADRRIVLGFIEPHFMAGFSGGYKGSSRPWPTSTPSCTTTGPRPSATRSSTWGVLDGNPTQDQIRRAGSLLPVDFLVNVTLNRKRQITRFFCGEVLAAHAAGCAFARQTAMAACERRYPIVVTTNAGYPSTRTSTRRSKECPPPSRWSSRTGSSWPLRVQRRLPGHGNFKRLLFEHGSPRALLDAIMAPGFSVSTSGRRSFWPSFAAEARVASQKRPRPRTVRKAHLEPVQTSASGSGPSSTDAVRRPPSPCCPRAP